MVRFCSAALLCLAVLRVSFFSLRSCALLWVQKAKKRTARGAKEASGGIKNVSKILPTSSQYPPKMAPGSLPGSLRRPLGAIWRRRWLPGALRGPSEGVPGASWVALGASGGAPGVLLASLGPLRRRPGHPPGGHFGLPGVLFARSAEKCPQTSQKSSTTLSFQRPMCNTSCCVCRPAVLTRASW